jgi:hypothetical protein
MLDVINIARGPNREYKWNPVLGVHPTRLYYPKPTNASSI